MKYNNSFYDRRDTTHTFLVYSYLLWLHCEVFLTCASSVSSSPLSRKQTLQFESKQEQEV